MRILDRYLGRQILFGTIFAIILLSLLLVLGNLFRELRPLLVEVGAPIGVLGEFILGILPVTLIYTIPWAFLSAVLLVFGRLSGDSELIAFRGAGVSLVRLAAPVIVLGLLFSAVCLWLNLHVAPVAKDRVRNLVTETIIKDPRALLSSGVDQTRIPNLRVYSERQEGDVFHNFHIFVMDDGDPGADPGGAYIHADTAETVVDEERRQIRLRLTGAYSDGKTPDGEEFTVLSRDLEWMVIDYSEERKKTKASSMTNSEIDRYLEDNPQLPHVVRAGFRSEQNERYSSSFACLAFGLIGVPLGIKARRRDTSSGLVLSLGVGAAYFIATSMIEAGERTQWLLWLPNLASVILAAALFRRARFR
jgi:lipopolysaccharide export system permease protein